MLTSPSCVPQDQGKGIGGTVPPRGTGLIHPGMPCQEHVEAGRPSLYPSVISNTSKEMSAFSDFPYPEDFPVFLPNARLLDYLRRYAERFGLREHIKFGVSDGCPGAAPLPVHAGHW